MILGIDEAGRGPALGPLVVCGVCLRARDDARLVRLGVRDSKAFGSHERARAVRASLAQAIREIAVAVELEVAEADEVDRWVSQGGLNRLEQTLAHRIIRRVPEANRIVADGARLFAPLERRIPGFRALDRADVTHPAVAAASIVAKVERDARFERLFPVWEMECTPLRGGGYPNEATAEFLRRYLARHRRLPACVRRSWNWDVLVELACMQAPAETAAHLDEDHA